MTVLNFPNSPAPGDKWPSPPVPSLPIYTWDGEKWTTISGSIGGGALAPPSTLLPLVDATPASTGVSISYSREDHIHPTDTTRAAVTALPVAATAAEFVANSAPTKMLTPGAAWGAAPARTITSGVAPDLSLAIDFYTGGVGGFVMANPINVKQGQRGIFWCIGGSVASWGTSYKFPNGVKPVSSGGWDIVSYVVWDVNNILCTSSLAHA